MSLHSYRYAIDNFNLLYRLVHAEELGFSKTDLLNDVTEMDNVVGRTIHMWLLYFYSFVS